MVKWQGLVFSFCPVFSVAFANGTFCPQSPWLLYVPEKYVPMLCKTGWSTGWLGLLAQARLLWFL